MPSPENTSAWWRSSAGALLAGPVAGAVTCAALALAGILRCVFNERFPVSSTTALIALAMCPLVLRAGRWQGGPRGALVGAVSMLPMALFLWMGAMWALEDPLVSMNWRCGTGDIGLVMITTPVLLILGLSGAVVGLPLAKERPRMDRALRYMAWLTVVVGLVLVTMATVRAHRFPTVDGYADALPVVGAIPARTQLPPGATHMEPARDGMVTVDEHTVSGVRIQRRCGQRANHSPSCVWYLGADPRSRDAFDQEVSSRTMVDRGDAVVVRHRPHTDVWILERRTPHGGSVPRWAFVGPDFIPCDLYVRSVAAYAAPPVGWIAGAWAGVLIAVGLLLRSNKVLADPRGRWHQGHHDGRGEVRLEDGTTLQMPTGVMVSEGPVVVLPTMDARIAGYRDHGVRQPLQVLPGTVEDLAVAAHVRPVVRSVLAMAAVWLTAAPLVAAAMAGLLR